MQQSLGHGAMEEEIPLKTFDDLIADVRFEFERLLARCKALADSGIAEVRDGAVVREAAAAIRPCWLSDGYDLGASARKLGVRPRRPSQPSHHALPEDLDGVVVEVGTTSKACQRHVMVLNGRAAAFKSSEGDAGEEDLVQTPPPMDASRSASKESTLYISGGRRRAYRMSTTATCSDRPSSAVMMTSERMEKLRMIFQKVDMNADGCISTDEIHAMLRSSGVLQISVEGLKESFASVKDPVELIDPESNGELTLDFDEFAAIILQPANERKRLPPGVAADFQLIRNLVIREEAKGVLEQFFEDAHAADKQRMNKPDMGKKIYERLDSFVATVILLNAFTLGFGTDMDSELLRGVELVFNVVYLLELTVKVLALGPVEFFFGSEWSWHWFDGVLCTIAFLEIVLHLAAYAESELNSGAVTLLRLVRLARLQRLVRLLRYRIFSELTLMIKGVSAGCRTLFWAIVLLFCVVYVFSLVLRQLLKQDVEACLAGAPSCSVHLQTGMAAHLDPAYIDQLIGSVPNAMFTVFRCVSGDCVTPTGTPVLMVLSDVYGALFIIPYCVAFLFVTFGLFNLIVAIFVETVMEAARQKRRLAADSESLQVGYKMQKLLIKLLNVEDTAGSQSCWKQMLRRVQDLLSIDRTSGGVHFGGDGPEFDMKITRAMFHSVVRDEEVKEILDDLDIGTGDRSDLFDVIDADGSGELDIQELIVGLMKLRGGADKSDVVAALLGVRALQKNMKGYMTEVNAQLSLLATHQNEVLERLPSCEMGEDEHLDCFGF
eukprot:TRINITY_DN42088_c0_g4_i1.p1 TRINITY_DN42088_c0_g4~~TRINITY_DN42088_c0_g4_i1.p1  ORF type:complete len:801 (+),score=172.26 TRINITY_DN42088_c0_g4_i1:78-2405(+)